MSRRAATGLSAAVALMICVAACTLPAGAQPNGFTPCTNHVAPPPRGPVLRADVDGDGRADRVWLAARMTADGACHFTAVATGKGWTAKLPVVRRGGISLPRLSVLATINSARGAEIVIELNHESQYSDALVLTTRGRRLVQLVAPRNPMNPAGVFGLFTFYNGEGEGGGTIQVDCPKPGTVVTAGFRWLSTGPDPYGDPHYYGERRTYRVTGSFRQVAATVLPNATYAEVEPILLPVEEWRPFRSCAVTPFA